MNVYLLNVEMRLPNLFFSKDLCIYFYVYGWVLCLCNVRTACICGPQKPEEAIACPGAGVPEGCDPPCRCWP